MSREDQILEKRIAEYRERCVHFAGTMGPGMKKIDSCNAGVRYDAVEVRHEPMPCTSRSGGRYESSRSLPCVVSLNHCGAPCAKRQEPTREEAEAHTAKADASIARVLVSRAAIVAAEKGKPTGGRGTIPCPNCAGELKYRIASSNGHIHAQCSTEGCASWME